MRIYTIAIGQPMPRALLSRVFAFSLALSGVLAAHFCGGCERHAMRPGAAVRTAATPTLREVSQADFEGAPVVQIMTIWGNAGSGVWMGDDTILTARHVLPRRGEVIEIKGKEVRFERLAQGEGSGTANDWALIRVRSDDGAVQRAIADHPAPLRERGPEGNRIREGDEVYILGYWRGQSRWLSKSQMRAVPLSIIKGSVISVSGGEKFSSLDHMFVVTPGGEIFPGASGGPVVRWNAREARFELLGIYVGAGEYQRMVSGEVGKVQIVRRVPAAARQAWNESNKPTSGSVLSLSGERAGGEQKHPG